MFLSGLGVPRTKSKGASTWRTALAGAPGRFVPRLHKLLNGPLALRK
jgi:hypothetical protein